MMATGAPDLSGAPPAPPEGDYVLENLTIVTVDASDSIIREGALVCRQGLIDYVGPQHGCPTRFASLPRLDCTHLIAMPGMINGHVHLDQALLRGVADDTAWEPFLHDVVFPSLRRRSTGGVLASLRLCLLELALGGVTTFVEPNLKPFYDLDRFTQEIQLSGLRGVLALCAGPEPANERSPESLGLSSVAELLSALHGRDDRIDVALAPEIPRHRQSIGDGSYLRDCAKLTSDLRVKRVLHHSSESDDYSYYRRTFGVTPTQFLSDHGLLDGMSILINCCWLDETDIDLIGESGDGVIHSPVANMKMNSGVASIVSMRHRGIPIGLGSDGPANNNRLDMFAEMRTSVFLQSLFDAPGRLRANDALRMATFEGAQAIGKSDQLGSIEVGKAADIVLVDTRQPHLAPLTDPVSNLVYCGTPSDVFGVSVAGEFVVWDGQHCRIDVQRSLQQVADEARIEAQRRTRNE